ncbi:MAG: RsmB/NOP family class I SAM-dependent RNA methyltransferase [Pseudomonadota bacterium]
MTPSARVQAAINILDEVLAGAPAEKALTGWARRSRFAGSKDRAAIRDFVYQALRCKRSYAALGGAEGGRGLMVGLARDTQLEIDTFFDGLGYGAPPLSTEEQEAGRLPNAEETRDLPDWIWQAFEDSLGATSAEQAAALLRQRAPIICRVNLRASSVNEAIELLSIEGVIAQPIALQDTAILLTEGARKLAQSKAYRQGVVELQDANSQAAMREIDVPVGARVLDYCAGGGGKTLALAARVDAHWFAHDAVHKRMVDLPKRAKRAGVNVALLEAEEIARNGPFDVVLCDVPCSGSGTWRRTPDAKWRLTPHRVKELQETQRSILELARKLVKSDGQLIYSTCSVLAQENEQIITDCMRQSKRLTLQKQRFWPISATGDGFFLSVMQVQ